MLRKKDFYLKALKKKEIKALLDAIAVCEGGKYNILVGGKTFVGYNSHPRIYVAKLDSTAAGRYQINWPTYQEFSQKLGLTDFTPLTQDIMAVALIDSKIPIEKVSLANLKEVAEAISWRWASIPPQRYPNQSMKTFEQFKSYYVKSFNSIKDSLAIPIVAVLIFISYFIYNWSSKL